MHKLREHAPRAAFLDLAQPAEDGKFVICHAHVRFVRLDVVFGDRLELSGGDSVQEPATGSTRLFKARAARANALVQNGQLERVAGVCNKLLQICLADRADRIDVRCEAGNVSTNEIQGWHPTYRRSSRTS